MHDGDLDSHHYLDLRRIGGEAVEVRRNPRRRRNAAARRENGRLIVELPPAVAVADEHQWLETMVRLLREKEGRRRGRTDTALTERAEILHARHIAPHRPGAPLPSRVTWATNQERRWGSCTPATGAIRLSRRLGELPQWVIDYVLVHELTHLVEPGHGPACQELVSRYPRAAEAKGYLAGYTAALQARLTSGEQPPGDLDEDGH